MTESPQPSPPRQPSVTAGGGTKGHRPVLTQLQHSCNAAPPPSCASRAFGKSWVLAYESSGRGGLLKREQNARAQLETSRSGCALSAHFAWCKRAVPVPSCDVLSGAVTTDTIHLSLRPMRRRLACLLVWGCRRKKLPDDVMRIVVHFLRMRQPIRGCRQKDYQSQAVASGHPEALWFTTFHWDMWARSERPRPRDRGTVGPLVLSGRFTLRGPSTETESNRRRKAAWGSVDGYAELRVSKGGLTRLGLFLLDDRTFMPPREDRGARGNPNLQAFMLLESGSPRKALVVQSYPRRSDLATNPHASDIDLPPAGTVLAPFTANPRDMLRGWRPPFW